MAKKTPKCIIDDAIKRGKQNISLLHDVQSLFMMQTKESLKTLLTDKPHIGNLKLKQLMLSISIVILTS